MKDNIDLYNTLLVAINFEDLTDFAYKLLEDENKIEFIKQLRDNDIYFENNFKWQFPNNTLSEICFNRKQPLDTNIAIYVKLCLIATDNVALKNTIDKIIFQFTR